MPTDNRRIALTANARLLGSMDRLDYAADDINAKAITNEIQARADDVGRWDRWLSVVDLHLNEIAEWRAWEPLKGVRNPSDLRALLEFASLMSPTEDLRRQAGELLQYLAALVPLMKWPEHQHDLQV